MSVLGIKAGTGGRGGKRKPTSEPSPLVLTIGHSTRTLEEFIGLLRAHGATRVVDVRTVPRSRRTPQFNKASLPQALKKAGVQVFDEVRRGSHYPPQVARTVVTCAQCTVRQC